MPVGRLLLQLALALAGAASLALRFPFRDVPLITDEAGYAYVAYWLQRGLVLYRDLWFDRPQGIFLVYSAILRLGGESTAAIRLAAGLYNAGTTILVGLLGVRLFGRPVGIVAAVVYAVASASPAVEGFTANGELFMNLPVVVALLLALERRVVLAGVALALATTIKPTALPAGAPALLAIALATPAGHGHWPFRAGVVARLAAGTLLGLAPFVLHGLATAPQTYWYAVVGFRVQAHSALSVGLPLAGELWQTAPTVLAAWLPAWLLAGYGLSGGGWRQRPGAIALTLLLGAFAGAAAGGYWYWHYYIGLLPAVAILAGAGAIRLAERPGVSGADTWAGGASPITAGGLGLATAAVLAIGVALFVNIRLIGVSPQETSWRIYRRPAYLVSQEIAAYVARHTTPEDTVYAAFAQADLYYLSRRRSASSHLYWTEINRVPGALEAVIDAIDDPRRRPKYVIRIDRELERPGLATAFWTRVEQLYLPETEIGGFLLFRRREVALG
jgi:hypothetical protein